jgi:carbonic anhydrase/acetyltransferase-like protein (isoleucine patch superfamily)
VLKTADALANPKLLTAIPAKVAKADPAAVALSDLLDVRVYVCSLTVLVHFSDNYDFGDVRAAYVHNEVLNVDMGFRFNAHVLTDAYAAPVVDLASYAAVSADVQRGWAYPLLPARNWAEDAARAGSSSSGSTHLWAPWTDRGRGVLVQEGAAVHPSATLARDVLVGAGATVGAGAFLCGCVVGPGAAVGAGARIEGSVLLGACRVGARAAVHEAVVGAAAEVGAGATVSAGAVLGSRVLVAAGHVLPPAARLSRVPAVEGLRRERPAGDAADEPAGVGAGGRGRVWPAESEVEEEEAGESDDEDEEDEEEDAAAAGADGVTTLSAAASATSGLSRALSGYRSAVRASRVEADSGAAATGAGDTSSAGVASALLALLAAVQAVLALPTAACGPSPAAVTEALAVLLPAAKGEATWLAPVNLQAAREAAAAASRTSAGAAFAAAPVAGAAATAGTSTTATAGTAAAGAGGPAAPSTASAAEAAQARFASGVADILTSRPIAGAEDIRHVTMEVKSFKYAENRTFADCVRAVLPIVLAAVPVKLGAAAATPGAAPATLPQFAAALDRTLALYKPMLAAFVNSIEDELAVVHAAEAYCTCPARRADYTPAFGILLNVLYQADLTSNVAVTAWVDSAEGGDAAESEDREEGSAAPAGRPAAGAGAGSAAAADPALEIRKELLATKWVQMLLARLDEEEEDDDEEDGDSEEEEDDDE